MEQRNPSPSMAGPSRSPAGPPRTTPCAPSANEYKDEEMLHVIAYFIVDGGEGREDGGD
jgi:hypothetical protein